MFRFLTFLFCFLSFSLFSQNRSIAEIDKTVQAMKNELNSYEREEPVNTKDSKKILYFKDDVLKVVEVREKAEIEKNVSWYFVQDKLIYSETNWIRPSDGNSIFNEKIYRYNDELIAWLNSENSFVDSNSPEFKKLDRDLKTFAARLLETSKK